MLQMQHLKLQIKKSTEFYVYKVYNCFKYKKASKVLQQIPQKLMTKNLTFYFDISSLSSGDGGTTTTGTHTTAGNSNNTTTDIQYGPGPSLRPQTEGSWIQGGSRPTSSGAASTDTSASSRNNSSGQLAAPPQLPVPVGQQPLPPQFRGVMPPFVSSIYSLFLYTYFQ